MSGAVIMFAFFKCSIPLHSQKICEVMNMLISLIESLHNVFFYQNIMLHTINTYNFYLSTIPNNNNNKNNIISK
jgi:hypothetical protein